MAAASFYDEYENVSDDEEYSEAEKQEYCFCKSFKYNPAESLECQGCHYYVHVRCSGNREFVQALLENKQYPQKKFLCFICRNIPRLIDLYSDDIRSSKRSNLLINMINRHQSKALADNINKKVWDIDQESINNLSKIKLRKESVEQDSEHDSVDSCMGLSKRLKTSHDAQSSKNFVERFADCFDNKVAKRVKNSFEKHKSRSNIIN